MKESDFVEIESAGFEIGFQAGFFGTKNYDERAVKKAKRKLLRLQQRHLTKLNKNIGGNQNDNFM